MLRGSLGRTSGARVFARSFGGRLGSARRWASVALGVVVGPRGGCRIVGRGGGLSGWRAGAKGLGGGLVAVLTGVSITVACRSVAVHVGRLGRWFGGGRVGRRRLGVVVGGLCAGAVWAVVGGGRVGALVGGGLVGARWGVVVVAAVGVAVIEEDRAVVGPGQGGGAIGAGVVVDEHIVLVAAGGRAWWSPPQ